MNNNPRDEALILGLHLPKPKSCQDCPAANGPCLRRKNSNIEADIIVVGECPESNSVGTQKPFNDGQTRIMRNIIDRVKQTDTTGKFKEIKIFYTYAVKAGQIKKPSAKHIAACSPLLLEDILSCVRPNGNKPVIITLGATTAKAVGLKYQKHKDIVGREFTLDFKRESGLSGEYKVFPTISLGLLHKDPGTVSVLIDTINLASQTVMGQYIRDKHKADEVSKGYRHPKTIEELRELIDEIIAYPNPEKASQSPITLDTETNCLKPSERPDPKTLLLSVGWDVGKASTIILDHPDCPYDLEEAQKEVDRLLTCDKPKVFHNWYFDKTFLEVVRGTGVKVTRPAWDTLLAEHFLDEDKKGFYALKTLIGKYDPDFSGYDQPLAQHLKAYSKKDVRLSHEDVLEYDKQNGCPPDYDPKVWLDLVEDTRAVLKIQGIKAAIRTLTQKDMLKEAKQHVRAIRKHLKIKSPTKKASATRFDVLAKPSGGFEAIETDVLCKYAAQDADVTYRIMRGQFRELEKRDVTYHQKRLASVKYIPQKYTLAPTPAVKNVMKSFYIPASSATADMKYRGMKVDQKRLKDTIREIDDRLDACSAAIKKTFGDINPNSSDQVLTMFGKIGMPQVQGKETSTDKFVLEHHVASFPQDDLRHQFADLLLEFRSSAKSSAIIHTLEEHCKNDGYIHASINMSGTTTGRLSSSDPNMQNVPLIVGARFKTIDGNKVLVHKGHNIKRLFVPSKKRHVIVNMDISAAEIRVFTAYAGDVGMREAVKEGLDLHSFTASKIYKIPYEEVVAKKETDFQMKKRRTCAKSAIFATIYGGGPATIAANSGITVNEAREVQQSLFTAFPPIKQYIHTVSNEVESKGELMTIFGRRRRFPLAGLSYRHLSKAKREGVNFLIQSTSSDLVLGMLIDVSENIQDIGGSLLMTVHDSLVMEVPEKNLDKLKPFFDHWVVERVEEKVGEWLKLPFAYDLEVGPSYGEMEPV